MQWELSLHGKWNFRMDPDGIGREDGWYKGNLEDTIMIPGILQGQGYGNDIDESTPWVSSLHDKLWYQREEYKSESNEVLIPFLCQPPKHYLGKAWYEKSFIIPDNLDGHEFYLLMELVKWKTSVWIDSVHVGEEIGLCTPHEYSLGNLNKGIHKVVICVDNSLIYPYRPDGHMVSDALSATFNGIVGEVKILSTKSIHIDNIKVYPDTNTKKVQVKLLIENKRSKELIVNIKINNGNRQIGLKPGCNIIEEEISFDKNTPLWDEFCPHLEKIDVVLEYEEVTLERAITFGFREIEVKNGLFYLNNRPTYFRGTHSGGDFPLTGHPSTCVNDWKRIFHICKDWGLNYIRFHSFCPPRAAFIAADEVGIYLQIECGMWNIFYDGCVMSDILWEETVKIIETYGNHPSFLMLSPSNEPGGDWFVPLTTWVEKCKEFDSRRIYTAQSGWFYPMEPAKIHGTDYVYFHRSGYGIEPGGTIRNSKGWHGKDYHRSVIGIKYPVISHELGQWCSYPDFDVIDKFTGYLQPGNYKAFKENARRRGVLPYNKEFAYSSGKRKVQLYKEEIEANFRTPSLYGFELLDLHDYIGQGSALVGMLDPFWDEKGFVTKEEFKDFCNETVPLLRISKRVFTSDEIMNYPVELCHFGKEDIINPQLYWEVKNDMGEVVESGSFNVDIIPIGKNLMVGNLVVSLDDFTSPKEYIIEIGIKDTNIKNSWNFFVFDKEVENIPKSYDEKVVYTNSITEAISNLKEGKKVIYAPKEEHHRLDSPPLSSKTSFWNSQMGPSYIRGMGLVCKNNHKALSLFPTKEYSDWQWSDILDGAYGLNLSYFPTEITPIALPIDDWNRNYKLGMILECRVEKGSLLIVTADIDTNLDERVSARQLRKSLFEYVYSEDFKPTCMVTTKDLLDSFYQRNIMQDYGVKVKEEYKNVIDGSPNTMYIKEDAYPLTIDMETAKEVYIKGMLYMPRQNNREHKGDIKGVKIEAFMKDSWIEVFNGEIKSSFDPKEILFKEYVRTKRIRFIAQYGFSGKDIPSFYETKEGWFPEVIDYEDKTVAIGNLLYIPVQMDFNDISNNVTNISLNKKNLEKSTTKEIDY